MFILEKITIIISIIYLKQNKMLINKKTLQKNYSTKMLDYYDLLHKKDEKPKQLKRKLKEEAKKSLKKKLIRNKNKKTRKRKNK